jgi:hypothetical protein
VRSKCKISLSAARRNNLKIKKNKILFVACGCVTLRIGGGGAIRMRWDVWGEVNDVAVGERRGFSRAGTEKGFGCVWVGAWEVKDVVDMWPLASCAAFRVQVPKKALDELSQGW